MLASSLFLNATDVEKSSEALGAETWGAWASRTAYATVSTATAVVSNPTINTVVGVASTVSYLVPSLVDALPYGPEARRALGYVGAGLLAASMVNAVATEGMGGVTQVATTGVMLVGRQLASKTALGKTALGVVAMAGLAQGASAALTYTGTLFPPAQHVDEDANGGLIAMYPTPPVIASNATQVTVTFMPYDSNSKVLPGAAIVAPGVQFSQGPDGSFYWTGTPAQINGLLAGSGVQVIQDFNGEVLVNGQLWEGDYAHPPALASLIKSTAVDVFVAPVNDAPHVVPGVTFSMQVDGAQTSHLVPGALASGFTDAQDGSLNGLALPGATIGMNCTQGVRAILVGDQPCNAQGPSLICQIPLPAFAAGSVSIVTPSHSHTSVACSLSATEGGLDPLISPNTAMTIGFTAAPPAPNNWQKLVAAHQSSPWLLVGEFVTGTILYGTYQSWQETQYKANPVAYQVAKTFGLWSVGSVKRVSTAIDLEKETVTGSTRYTSTVPLIGRFFDGDDRFVSAINMLRTRLATDDHTVISKWILQQKGLVNVGRKLPIFMGKPWLNYKKAYLDLDALAAAAPNASTEMTTF